MSTVVWFYIITPNCSELGRIRISRAYRYFILPGLVGSGFSSEFHAESLITGVVFCLIVCATIDILLPVFNRPLLACFSWIRTVFPYGEQEVPPFIIWAGAGNCSTHADSYINT
jgi:hypothetical protein